MTTKKLQSITSENEIAIYKGIICAVNIHLKAMELVIILYQQNIILALMERNNMSVINFSWKS
jgi:hypothetical protein